jgi:cutinase
MKFQSAALAAFLYAVTLVLSSPIKDVARLEARQSSTSNELEDGPCKEVFFIFARGSTETGNMVSISFSPSPSLCLFQRLELLSRSTELIKKGNNRRSSSV